MRNRHLPRLEYVQKFNLYVNLIWMAKENKIDPENFLIITKNSEIRNNNDLKNVYSKSVKL